MRAIKYVCDLHGNIVQVTEGSRRTEYDIDKLDRVLKERVRTLSGGVWSTASEIVSRIEEQKKNICETIYSGNDCHVDWPGKEVVIRFWLK